MRACGHTAQVCCPLDSRASITGAGAMSTSASGGNLRGKKLSIDCLDISIKDLASSRNPSDFIGVLKICAYADMFIFFSFWFVLWKLFKSVVFRTQSAFCFNHFGFMSLCSFPLVFEPQI